VFVPVLSAADLEWYFDEGARVELMKLHSEIERWIIKSSNSPPYGVILEDRPMAKNPRVFVRGNPANKGEEVPREYLELLSGPQRKPFQKGSGRLEMAQAIANKENPLTARVMVNRVWLGHFGAGLVRTPSDFGTRSEPPTHPELLDWLAGYLMDEGWSLKKLHRLIVLSSVYRQRSDMDAATADAVDSKTDAAGVNVVASAKSSNDPAQVDPENRLLWRMNRARLDFETMRDSLLAVSGELDLRMEGKPEELFKAPISKRRTVYGFIDRQFLPSVMRVFDFANPDMHSPQRANTTVPQQALFFMNNPFLADRCRAVLERSEIRAVSEATNKVRELYRAVYQRNPTPEQIEEGIEFVRATEAAPPFEIPPPPPPIWHYGFGEFDAPNKQIRNFTALPYFAGDAWQGGEMWPDEKLGWVRLTADGGHAGNDLQHAAIRRWVAPRDATISISGTIKHEHKEGDGIEAGIVSSRSGVLGTWKLHDSKADAKVESLEVKQGDTIDFFVNFNEGLNHDEFVWAPKIKMAKGESGAESKGWDAQKEFGGPPAPLPKPLTAWEEYVQVLLLSNEFVFVD
jgi:hypothetical protein